MNEQTTIKIIGFCLAIALTGLILDLTSAADQIGNLMLNLFFYNTADEAAVGLFKEAHLKNEMSIKEILSVTKHRPWTIPPEQWKYYQEWNNAVFLHWQVDLSELQKIVPDDLEIDLYEGKPWVSLVAFTMEKSRPKNLPSFSPISDFDEINIRTYVKRNNQAGVYFLSIEGGTQISCRIAKTLSELPYRHSKMKRQGTIYRSENRQFKEKMHIKYEVGQELQEKAELDRWLTERYALFQDTKTSINEFEIHHVEWPIYGLDIKEIEIEYPRFKKFLNNLPDRKHYSPGVQVIAWDKKRR